MNISKQHRKRKKKITRHVEAIILSKHAKVILECDLKVKTSYETRFVLLQCAALKRNVFRLYYGKDTFCTYKIAASRSTYFTVHMGHAFISDLNLLLNWIPFLSFGYKRVVFERINLHGT